MNPFHHYCVISIVCTTLYLLDNIILPAISLLTYIITYRVNRIMEDNIGYPVDIMKKYQVVILQKKYRPDLLPFCLWQNVRCRIRQAGFEQHPTGVLHLVFQIWPFPFQNKKDIRMDVLFVLEVPARFELANESFADSCLTTWPRYHTIKTGTRSVPILFDWSG